MPAACGGLAGYTAGREQDCSLLSRGSHNRYPRAVPGGLPCVLCRRACRGSVEEGVLGGFTEEAAFEQT